MSKIFTICLMAFSSLAACSKKDMQVPSFVPAPVPPVAIDTTPLPARTWTWLALGDSYTIGQSVPVADRFPNQTARLLLADSVQFETPEIIAQTGWTTGNLLNRLNSTPPMDSTYDIVSLLIGVNNQYQHLSQTQYSAEFRTLLNKSIQYAGGEKKRVVVISIPDYGVTPYAGGSDRALIAAQIDSFNLINRNISSQLGVNYVFITDLTRLAATDPTLVASDGLHPSGIEYNKWAGRLAPVIKMALHY